MVNTLPFVFAFSMWIVLISSELQWPAVPQSPSDTKEACTECQLFPEGLTGPIVCQTLVQSTQRAYKSLEGHITNPCPPGGSTVSPINSRVMYASGGENKWGQKHWRGGRRQSRSQRVHTKVALVWPTLAHRFYKIHWTSAIAFDLKQCRGNNPIIRFFFFFFEKI